MTVVSAPSATDNLSTWLTYMGGIHVSAIDMGLERVRPVFGALGFGGVLNQDGTKPCVFVVAGTNGKGSTTAVIAEITKQAGYKTGLYQSPHLVSFNERVRINGQEADDEALVRAFVKVEEARVACGLSLSFFEMTTLAAFVLFAEQNCAVWVLEVGLGGRLDVVNLVDASVSVITNVAIDHVDWLGDNREAIGAEKAGILRSGVPLIYGEEAMPDSVATQIAKLGVPCWQYGQDYAFIGGDAELGTHWVYSASALTLRLPLPRLALVNVSAAISAVLASTLGVDHASIGRALECVKLAGRFDSRLLMGRQWLFDVAHNGAGARFLMRQFVPYWQAHVAKHPQAKLVVLFSMLADKDVDEVLEVIQKSELPIEGWHIATLDNARAMASEVLYAKLMAMGAPKVMCYDNMTQAALGVVENTTANELILVFGSFYTISESLVALGAYQGFRAVE